MKRQLRGIARWLIPLSWQRGLVQMTRWPPVGWVRFGSLRRLKPISRDWGMDRGRPIDRYYIERFLEYHAANIQGVVLEIGDNKYTRHFGGDRVRESIVLHVAEQRERVTLIGDLTEGDNIPSGAFDCVILTQTLQAIYDVPAAIATVYRILKPGGAALVTVPGISKISRYDMERWGYYWSFTTCSISRLFAACFPLANLEVEAKGNVLATIAFLHGLASQELRQDELDAADPDYELLITVRAIKPGAPR